MNEEMKSILKMVESGKITADEGQKLIESLGTKHEVISSTPKSHTSKFIHIEVTDNDKDDGKSLVKVNVPIALAKSVLKMGKIKDQILLNAPGVELDFEEIIHMIENNAVGELVNIETADNTVRIWID